MQKSYFLISNMLMNSYATKVKKSTSITVQTTVSNDRNFDNYIYHLQ